MHWSKTSARLNDCGGQVRMLDLHTASPRRDMKAEPQTLYESRSLRVFTSEFSKDRGSLLAVCFQYRVDHQRLERQGFASEFLARLGIPAVFVNCASNEWYQYPDLPDALRMVRAVTGNWDHVFTLGSSMGGYAALRFAALVGACRSIAIGPQYSPRSSRVAEEVRYDSDVRNTRFLFEDGWLASNEVENYLVFDSLLKIDSVHALRYLEDARVNLVRVPCAGHSPTVVIGECGFLDSFILDLAMGVFKPSEFRAAFRGARSRSPQYWREVHGHLTDLARWECADRIASAAALQHEGWSPNHPKRDHDSGERFRRSVARDAVA